MYLVFIDTFRKMAILMTLPDDCLHLRETKKNVITRVHILFDFFPHAHFEDLFLRNWFEAETSRDCAGYDPPTNQRRCHVCSLTMAKATSVTALRKAL